jgi:type IV pilus assembly protein PilV
MIAFRSFRRVRASPQRGSFMLEALIAILIVALGVLGIVGLYARSVQNVDDSKFRGEAALLVSTLVGQMWISDPKTASLVAKFDSSGSGAEYTEFAALVAQRLPNSVPPVVTVTPGPTATSSNVAISIQWKHPGDTNDPTPRKYDVNAVIGANQ